MKAEMSRFIEILESYEHLLHAETQAIAAKDVNLVEEILQKKDQCISDLIRSKENLSENPRDDSEIDTLIDKVDDLQKRNFSTFSLLVEQQRSKRTGQTSNKEPSNYRRLRQTYLGTDSSRITNLWD